MSLVVLLAGLLIFVISQLPLKPLSRANVALTFFGYTNIENASIRLAVFSVTNLSSSIILVRRPMVENLVYDSSNWPRWQAMLDSGASASFTVPVPTNPSPWRLYLDADPDVGTARAIVRAVEAFPFGWYAARRHPYVIQSDWVQSKK